MTRKLLPEELRRLGDFISGFYIFGIWWQLTIYGLSFYTKGRLAIRFCTTIDEVKEAIRNLQNINMCIDRMIENRFSIEFCDDECPDFFAIRNGFSIHFHYTYIERRFYMHAVVNHVTIHIESPSQMVEEFQKNQIYVV
jgi:hypothetical protein